MPRDKIKKIVEESKRVVEKDRAGFVDSVKKDLDSFKRKALRDL